MDENLATLKAKLRQLRIDIVREEHKEDSPKFQEYKALDAQIKAIEKPAASAEEPTAAAAEAKPAVTSGFFAAAANSEASTNAATNTAKP
ncbi:MAG: hypothetical protein EBY16_01490 [Gammaproteobacteria bacterium]|nr:hypothetical protein [Gammaproteobacteria bacterium]